VDPVDRLTGRENPGQWISFIDDSFKILTHLVVAIMTKKNHAKLVKNGNGMEMEK
jgi:hypothetical protein